MQSEQALLRNQRNREKLLPYYAQDINGYDLNEIDEQVLTPASEKSDNSAWIKAY